MSDESLHQSISNLLERLMNLESRVSLLTENVRLMQELAIQLSRNSPLGQPVASLLSPSPPPASTPRVLPPAPSSWVPILHTRPTTDPTQPLDGCGQVALYLIRRVSPKEIMRHEDLRICPPTESVWRTPSPHEPAVCASCGGETRLAGGHPNVDWHPAFLPPVHPEPDSDELFGHPSRRKRRRAVPDDVPDRSGDLEALPSSSPGADAGSARRPAPHGAVALTPEAASEQKLSLEALMGMIETSPWAPPPSPLHEQPPAAGHVSFTLEPHEHETD